MIHRSLLLIALGFTLSTLSAQEFDFGVKGGINVASIGGGTYAGLGGLGSKIGFHVGAVAAIPISDKFAAQPELLFSSQGTKWNFVGSSNLRLDYINLPILAKYSILEGLSVEAGPQLGMLLASNVDKEDYKGIDVAFAIGASYRLTDAIFFSLRYNKGLSDINNNDAITVSNQNNVLQISAGYAF